ncbi:MAG: hypothetical protein JRJ12_12640 [Deltaproteobacteria bacterium]|nr:hypothetical protein [Deltaproteobacteria bacterium]MBW2072319.1 hypothetical protein [Deltaproteobacteria bacterium]
MEKNVRKELDTLRTMVLNWKRSYLSYATPEGDDGFLADEFSEEISRHVSPLIRRLFETRYLSHSEACEFLDYCYAQVEEVRILVSETEEKQG